MQRGGCDATRRVRAHTGIRAYTPAAILANLAAAPRCKRIHKLEPSSAGLAIEVDRGKDAKRDEGQRVSLPMLRKASRSACRTDLGTQPTNASRAGRPRVRLSMDYGPGETALSNKTGAAALLVPGNTRRHRVRRKEVLADGKR